MITEACEYTNSFHSFAPTIGIILNVAEDHLDFFKDIHDIRDSFRKYAQLIPEDGALIINSDIEELELITSGLSCNVITVGTNPDNSDFSAENIVFDNFARPSFDLIYKNEALGRISLQVTGLHNVYNSLAAIATAKFMGISMEDIVAGLMKCGGADRRFQYKGSLGDITIIDDYAHHPDEIMATLTTAKHYPHEAVWCVFQPHTYTRTKALMDDFATALSLADKIVLSDIYAAREKNTLGVSSKDLLDKLLEKGCDAHYFPTFDEIENFLLKNCIHGDLVITMGAGDVYKIGERLLGR